MANFKFPTEMVDLPSKGHFYVDGHPLSKGKVEVKYMTAREEDILTSQNLIKQGVVIDKLLQSLIVDKSIKVDDMLVGDKNAIMVAARILGYGKNYEIEYEGEKYDIDLSKLEAKPIDFSKHPRGVNDFTFKLPNSERTVTFKLLNGSDEKEIDLEVRARKKITNEYSSELTSRLKRIIKSVDGNSDPQFINNFVDNEFLSVDSLEFRKNLNSITPDVDMTTKIVDSEGKETQVTIPVTVRFFWPTT
tara:strand:- start:1502 stop:2242 length:741 start_codon:yes stop_codon:yes gene_type:complete